MTVAMPSGPGSTPEPFRSSLVPHCDAQEPVADRPAVLTVTANPSLDRTYQLAGVAAGALNRADAATVEPSGKGINVSRVLAALGRPSHAVCTAGGWEGRQLVDLLPPDGPVTVTAVPVTGATRVNTTLLVPGLPATKINEPGAPLTADEADALLTAVTGALPGAGWLACCGSLPAGAEPLLYRRMLTAARQAGVPTAVDTSGQALRVAVRARPDLVAPNADELAELTGLPVATPEQAVSAAAEVHARTGGRVLASLGPHGAVLIGPDGAWHATGPAIDPVNATGAGDALLAGYLAAGPPAAGVPEPRRLAAAVAVATSACLAAGTAELPAEPVHPDTVIVRPLPAPPGSTARSRENT